MAVLRWQSMFDTKNFIFRSQILLCDKEDKNCKKAQKNDKIT
jgi:hypothetical protein